MSLRVVAIITAAAGHEDEVADALTTLAQGTRTETGCRSYELFRSAADTTAFVTVEEWDGQDDLDAHMQGTNIADALTAVGGMLAGPPVIHPLAPVA